MVYSRLVSQRAQSPCSMLMQDLRLRAHDADADDPCEMVVVVPGMVAWWTTLAMVRSA